MSRRLSVLITVLALAFSAFPAGAEVADPCVDAETGEALNTQQQTYIHQAETKVGNLGALGATGLPSWDEEAPTTSVQGGAGGGYLGNSASYLQPDLAEQTGLTIEGTYTGCLDTMLVELYAIMPTNRTGTSGELNESSFTGTITLSREGEIVGYPVADVDVATVTNENGNATYRLRFALTEIAATLADIDVDPNGEHNLRLNVAPRYINTDNTVFVYDATEVPAGIQFNGTPDETYTAVSLF